MIKTIKELTTKAIQKVRGNPLKAKLLLLLIYPILPVAALASYFLWKMASSINHVNLDLSDVLPVILGIIWFVGGPAGLIGGLLILFNKVSRISIALFIYGSISYSIIAAAYIYEGFFRAIIGFDYWMGLHSIYLLFTFWVIGQQLLTFYKNRNKKEVLA